MIERRNLCGNSEILKWLQEFMENFVVDEIPLQGGSHASSSHEVSLEPTAKRPEDLGKHNVHTHFPKDRNFEICKRTKITRASCRRRNKRQLRISKQSSICIRSTGFCHSMDPGVSVTQNFTRNPEKLAKVHGTRKETKSHLQWQFPGIRKSL